MPFTTFYFARWLNIGTVSAWITVDGVEVPEYDVQYSPDGTEVTCWIVSQIDKNFSVNWNATNQFVSKLGRVTVDGIFCRGVYSMPSGTRAGPFQIHSAATSPTTERPLMFSRLELTDDDAYIDTPVSPALGDIRLKVTEVHKLYKSHKTKGARWSLKETEKIHERAKKGSVHRVKFGEEVTCPKIGYSKSTHVRTLGVFTFKYRPLDVLQANGIAPVEHNAIIPVAPKEILDLTLDDDTDTDRKPDVAEKIKRLEEELRILKETEGSGRKKKRIKTEVKTEPRNFLEPGQIIDLT